MLTPAHLIPARDRRARFVFVCDHASRASDPAFGGDLGLDEAVWRSHAAWDIGAERLTRALCDRFGAGGVLAGFSRLLADPNRPEDAPDLAPATADFKPAPGNLSLSPAGRASRIEALHRPYHAALARHLEVALAGNPDLMVVALHTFTPRLGEEVRPWSFGVLWNLDPKTGSAFVGALRSAAPGHVVGDNQPYDGRRYNHTLDVHAGPRGLSHVSLETSQGLFEREADAIFAEKALGDALEAAYPPVT